MPLSTIIHLLTEQRLYPVISFLGYIFTQHGAGYESFAGGLWLIHYTNHILSIIIPTTSAKHTIAQSNMCSVRF